MIALHTYRDKTLAVVGLGGSGKAVLAAAIAGGARVQAWDDAADRCTPMDGVTYLPPSAMAWDEIDTLVLAPGIPLTHPVPHPVVRLAHDHQVEVIGDVELFLRQCPDQTIIAITGTNGKSTTTALTGHVLAEAGFDVRVAGNIGRPILSIDPPADKTVMVLELSSYQIDLTPSLAPHVAVLLNITPDHLDRHGGMDGYVSTKSMVFAQQRPGSLAILGQGDQHCRSLTDQIIGRQNGPSVCPLNVDKAADFGIYALQGRIFDNGLVGADISEVMSLRGSHNHQNAAAAYAIARALNVPAASIENGMKSFPGLAHRMEQVATVNGVTFINDSKATNPDAAARALASYDRIYWLAGGKPKDAGLDPVFPYLDHVVAGFYFGEAAPGLDGTLAALVNGTQCATLHQATEMAWQMAVQDDHDAVILLSPACASFDQFDNFEARGDAFRRAVYDVAGIPVTGGSA